MSIGHAENCGTIAALVRGADLLFIEAMFLDEDAAHAKRKFHLTGGTGRRDRARRAVEAVVPFHMSPRYTGAESRVVDELQRAFAG